MGKEIRVLVVDDSAVMRNVITDMIDGQSGIKVVGSAKNGAEALTMIEKLKPNVVTMDIEMPVMDGLTALQHIMNERPIPVVMLSAEDKRQADITFKALEMGAVDFIPKTSGSLSLDLNKERGSIISKVLGAASVKVRRMGPVRSISSYHTTPLTKGDWIVMIGTSTGGPKALPEVLYRLPPDLPAGVLVVQHMPEGFTRSFAERLNWSSSLEVKEAKDGDVIEPGIVLLAPGNKHMAVVGNKVHLNDNEKVNFVRPSVDVMMMTGAPFYGPRTVGVILTGMGSDGAAGMKTIKENGGKTIVQDEDSCTIYGMPKAVVDEGCADVVSPLDMISERIIEALNEGGA